MLVLSRCRGAASASRGVILNFLIKPQCIHSDVDGLARVRHLTMVEQILGFADFGENPLYFKLEGVAVLLGNFPIVCVFGILVFVHI